MHTTNRWSDVFENKTNGQIGKFQVHVEASTRCNSRCVLCPRFVDFTPTTNPNLVLDEIKLDKFVKWFPPETLKFAHQFHFCGNYGDPISCVDLDKVIEYLAVNNVPNIVVRTNGGVRNTSFWTNMAKHLNSPNRYVVFSVDGLEDTNHLYRREVRWKNVVKNIQTFNSNGGYSKQDFLVFKHNEHQLEQVEKFASEIGIKEISFKQAFGFDNELGKFYNPVPALDLQGNLTHWLEKPDYHKRKDFTDRSVDKDRILRQAQKTVKLFNSDYEKYESHIENSVPPFINNLEENTIQCRAIDFPGTSNYREFYLNPEGTVSPCCFMGFLPHSKFPTEDKQTRENLKPYSDLDLNQNDLRSIFKVLDNKIADKWNKKHSEGRSYTCSKVCGQRDTSIRSLKEHTVKSL